MTVVRWRPNVIVVGEYGMPALYAAIYAKLFRASVVQFVENEPNFLLAYGKQRTGHATRMYRAMLSKGMCTVLAANEHVRTYLTTQLNVNAKKILVGPFITSAACFTPRSWQDGRIIKVVAIGQLIPRKGFSTLVEQIAALPAKLRKRFHFTVVGDGPLMEELRATIVDRHLDNVDLYGYVDYAAISKMLAQSDLFLMPTLGDYRSLAMFEALSSGLALVGSVYDGATREVVEVGANGFEYDPRKQSGLRDVLEKVNGSDLPTLWAASDRIAQNFTVARAAQILDRAISKANES